MIRKLAPLLLALAACRTPSQPFEGRPVLADIDFVGNKSIGKGELLAKIVSQPTNTGWFFLPKTAHYYEADLFAIDLKRIVRWYNEKGFYEAKIADVQELTDSEGRVSVRVTIDEGRRATIRKMDYAGAEGIPPNELKDIDVKLPIHPGDAFDEDGYEKAKEVLASELKEHGFAEAKVSGKVVVAPESGVAEIQFTLELGPRFVFGKVVVSGNRQIPGNEIANATGIERGQRFSPSALALAQQHVYNLGAFSGVRVGLEPLGAEPIAAVRVNVREAPFHTVRFGGGLLIEQSRWELPRLRAEYTNRSLFGGLRRLELAATVGYAFVESPFSYQSASSGIVTLTSAQLVVPNVLLPSLDFITRGEFAREVQPGYSYDEVAARVSLLYRRGRHSISPSLNFVRYFKTQLGDTQLQDLINRNGIGAGILRECGSGCTLTYPELRYTYDARDNAIETTEGFLITASVQQTLKPGTFTYFRFDPEVRFFSPVNRFVVLATRAQWGGFITEGGSATPFTQRFFGGGQSWQRGYGPYQQGPRLGAKPCQVGVDVNCPAPYATDTVPIGGTSAILLSGEVRVRADYLLNHLGIVFFVDASRVTNNNWADPFGGGLEVAPGLGLRYLTPFGPVRLDVGYVVNPKQVTALESTDPNTGQVIVAPTRVGDTCGGAPDCIHQKRWAFHITLGEAF